MEKPFFPSLLAYMMSGPVTCMVWEGTNAVKVGRMMLGETNPQVPSHDKTARFCSHSYVPSDPVRRNGTDLLTISLAAHSPKQRPSTTGHHPALQASLPGSIRGDFSIEVGRNICHGSDSVENAEKEIPAWFPSYHPLGSARARLLRLLGARLVAPCSSALPGWAPATGPRPLGP